MVGFAAVLAGCGGDGAVGAQDAYDLTEAQRACATRTPRGEALQTPVEGLVATGDVPLPSWAPDADGYFHPADGYVEGGTFAGAGDVEPVESLRVVEWNVERGQKLDKAIALMAEIDADVWILNETDLHGHKSGGVVVAREIARALGYSYVTATEFYELRDDRRGSSGDAIVSRFPIRHAEKIDTPIFADRGGYDWANSKSEPRCGQRSALRADIEVPTANGTVSVPVVALHLENKANRSVRKMQFEAVVDALVEPGEPTIVAGDLNTISPFEGRKFRKYLRERVEHPEQELFDCSRGDDDDTFSAVGFIRMRIDWMLVHGGPAGQLTCPEGSYEVLDNDGASDHKPVLTEFTLGYAAAP